jgi:hypothetical protein
MTSLALQGNMPEILLAEADLRKLPQADYELKHFQIPGVYVRQITVKAGCGLTGKIHKHRHISTLCCGTLCYATADGAAMITGPVTMIDDPGTKRIGYAVTDITFQNIIRTDLESIEDIEADISFDTFDEYEAYKLLNKDNDKWLL